MDGWMNECTHTQREREREGGREREREGGRERETQTHTERDTQIHTHTHTHLPDIHLVAAGPEGPL
jgi:hypothetical protein